jgi:hypothetical protein
MAHICRAKSTTSMLFFSGRFDVFHGSETDLKSVAYAADTRGAREKCPALIGTPGT